jgi:hypothetical protein
VVTPLLGLYVNAPESSTRYIGVTFRPSTYYIRVCRQTPWSGALTNDKAPHDGGAQSGWPGQAGYGSQRVSSPVPNIMSGSAAI